MKNKNNSCSDIDLSKIHLNCCGNEAITVIPCSEYLDSRLPNTGKVNQDEQQPERIIDSHGNEKMIIPKFELKGNPYFLNTHKP